MEKKIHITKHSDNQKMESMFSINSNTLSNTFCQAQRKTDSICKSCYAFNQLTMYENNIPPLQNNSNMLSTGILKENELPFLNHSIFRFNSFGELINLNHLHNLVQIAKKNKNTVFTLWTKRKNLIEKYFADEKKPKNLILIFSSYKLNQIEILPDFFDKVFTVFTAKYAIENKVNINCGNKKCINCRLCYSHNKIKNVNEVLKSERKTFYKTK
jgi:hypothetical protein